MNRGSEEIRFAADVRLHEAAFNNIIASFHSLQKRICEAGTRISHRQCGRTLENLRSTRNASY